MSPELEYQFGSTHWLDAWTPPLEQHLADLTDQVGLLLEQMAGAPTLPAAASGVAAQKQPWTLAHTLSAGWDVNDCAFSTDGLVVLTADSHGNLELWDIHTGKLLAALSWARDALDLAACAFSLDGQTIASAGLFYLRLWANPLGQDSPDSSTDAGFRLTVRHEGSIRDCAFSPDGKMIVSTSVDEALKLWDVVSGVCEATLASRTGAVVACALPPDGQTIVSVGKGKRGDCVELWEMAGS